MLSERYLTLILRHINKKILTFDRLDKPSLPKPPAGRKYLLYAHVPFCESLCPYCSFNRFVFDEDRARAYFRDLRREMRRTAELGYDFKSMYIGGGTPTILVDELVQTITLARDLFGVTAVSTETNPNHLIPDILDPLAPLVQRLSVGVQSFNDTILRQIGRLEKYGSGREILAHLRNIEGRFQALNVDMIFNFPGQTEEALLRDIEMVAESRANQTTFYPLMVSPSVEASLSRSVGKVDYTREARYYELVCAKLREHFEADSVWTFSRAGAEMIDEYVLDYDEYVGIGSGSFSYLNGTLYCNTFSLDEYAETIEKNRCSITAVRKFSPHEQMRYRFMMGLFGLKLDKSHFRQSFGISVEQALWAEKIFMGAMGAFDRDDLESITLTPKGRYLLVAMMREFFSGVNHLRDQARAALVDQA